MSTKLETARRAADYACAQEVREKQIGQDLATKKGAAEVVLIAAETNTRALQR